MAAPEDIPAARIALRASWFPDGIEAALGTVAPEPEADAVALPVGISIVAESNVPALVMRPFYRCAEVPFIGEGQLLRACGDTWEGSPSMAVRDGNGAPLVIFPFRNRVVYIRDDEEAGMLPAEIVAHYYWSYPEVTRQAMPEVLRTAAWALLVDWNNNGHPLED